MYAPRSAPTGVTKFCVQVADTLNGGGAKVCVTIVVPFEQGLRFFIPLEPLAPGAHAECPDSAVAAGIAAEYGSAVRTQPGVHDLEILGINCSWIVSGFMADGRFQCGDDWSGARAAGGCSI